MKFCVKKIVLFFLFVIFAQNAFSQELEGTAMMAEPGYFPDTGYYAASNSVANGTVINVTNLANFRTVQVTVAARLSNNSYSHLVTLSKDAAYALGINAYDLVARVRVASPTIEPAYSRYNDGRSFSGDPDYDPRAFSRANPPSLSSRQEMTPTPLTATVMQPEGYRVESSSTTITAYQPVQETPAPSSYYYGTGSFLGNGRMPEVIASPVVPVESVVIVMPAAPRESGEGLVSLTSTRTTDLLVEPMTPEYIGGARAVVGRTPSVETQTSVVQPPLPQAFEERPIAISPQNAPSEAGVYLRSPDVVIDAPLPGVVRLPAAQEGGGAEETVLVSAPIVIEVVEDNSWTKATPEPNSEISRNATRDASRDAASYPTANSILDAPYAEPREPSIYFNAPDVFLDPPVPGVAFVPVENDQFLVEEPYYELALPNDFVTGGAQTDKDGTAEQLYPEFYSAPEEQSVVFTPGSARYPQRETYVSELPVPAIDIVDVVVGEPFQAESIADGGTVYGVVNSTENYPYHTQNVADVADAVYASGDTPVFSIDMPPQPEYAFVTRESVELDWTTLDSGVEDYADAVSADTVSMRDPARSNDIDDYLSYLQDGADAWDAVIARDEAAFYVEPPPPEYALLTADGAVLDFTVVDTGAETYADAVNIGDSASGNDIDNYLSYLQDNADASEAAIRSEDVAFYVETPPPEYALLTADGAVLDFTITEGYADTVSIGDSAQGNDLENYLAYLQGTADASDAAIRDDAALDIETPLPSYAVVMDGVEVTPLDYGAEESVFYPELDNPLYVLWTQDDIIYDDIAYAEDNVDAKKNAYAEASGYEDSAAEDSLRQDSAFENEYIALNEPDYMLLEDDAREYFYGDGMFEDGLFSLNEPSYVMYTEEDVYGVGGGEEIEVFLPAEIFVIEDYEDAAELAALNEPDYRLREDTAEESYGDGIGEDRVWYELYGDATQENELVALNEPNYMLYEDSVEDYFYDDLLLEGLDFSLNEPDYSLREDSAENYSYGDGVGEDGAWDDLYGGAALENEFVALNEPNYMLFEDRVEGYFYDDLLFDGLEFSLNEPDYSLREDSAENYLYGDGVGEDGAWDDLYGGAALENEFVALNEPDYLLFEDRVEGYFYDDLLLEGLEFSLNEPVYTLLEDNVEGYAYEDLLLEGLDFFLNEPDYSLREVAVEEYSYVDEAVEDNAWDDFYGDAALENEAIALNEPEYRLFEDNVEGYLYDDLLLEGLDFSLNEPGYISLEDNVDGYIYEDLLFEGLEFSLNEPEYRLFEDSAEGYLYDDLLEISEFSFNEPDYRLWEDSAEDYSYWDGALDAEFFALNEPNYTAIEDSAEDYLYWDAAEDGGFLTLNEPGYAVYEDVVEEYLYGGYLQEGGIAALNEPDYILHEEYRVGVETYGVGGGEELEELFLPPITIEVGEQRPNYYIEPNLRPRDNYNPALNVPDLTIVEVENVEYETVENLFYEETQPYEHIPLDVFVPVETVPQTETVIEIIAPPIDVVFVPSASALEKGKRYVQIGGYSNKEKLYALVKEIGSKFPVLIMGERYILVGPLNEGESNALEQRFRAMGYTNAFVVVGK